MKSDRTLALHIANELEFDNDASPQVLDYIVTNYMENPSFDFKHDEEYDKIKTISEDLHLTKDSYSKGRKRYYKENFGPIIYLRKHWAYRVWVIICEFTIITTIFIYTDYYFDIMEGCKEALKKTPDSVSEKA